MNFFISSSEIKGASYISGSFFLFAILSLTTFIFISYIVTLTSPVRTFPLVTLIKESKINFQDAEIITLGHSHNRAILLQELDKPMLHLYTGGQNFKESLFLLDYFRARLKKVKLILVPVTVGSLQQPSEIRIDLVESLIALDDYNTFTSTILSEKQMYVNDLLKAIVLRDNWIGLIGELLVTKQQTKHIDTEKKLNPFLKISSARHINIMDISRQQRVENLFYIMKIAMIASELDSCLVLYDSPVSSAYIEDFMKHKPEFENWKHPFSNFIRDNENKFCVYFLESLWPTKNSKKRLYYRDQDHLNETGASVFTSLINKKINHMIKN